MKVVLTLIFMLSTWVWAQSSQLIVVTTKTWESPEGKLQRYERDAKGWHTVGKPIDILLGKNGLGWGKGLHTVPKDATNIKKEGDGKSPAGIFALRQAFGYEPFETKYPYKVYKETDHCVDDVNSKFYNKMVDSAKVQGDYCSHEKMKFPKDYYKYGVVVDHNGIGDGETSVKGAGSCIFLHIKDIPTAGCTVMNEAQIKEIIRWLDISKKPLLVQGTEEIIPQLLKQI